MAVDSAPTDVGRRASIQLLPVEALGGSDSEAGW